MNNSEEFVVIWEAPKLVPPEFRLYYDNNGRVICYSGDSNSKIEGNYIVIDALTFAEARQDIRVVNGKITKPNNQNVVCKLMPSTVEGTQCSYEDVSIVVDDSYSDKKQLWKLTTYEL